jgi:hypothetical protein
MSFSALSSQKKNQLYSSDRAPLRALRFGPAGVTTGLALMNKSLPFVEEEMYQTVIDIRVSTSAICKDFGREEWPAMVMYHT